MKNNNNEHGRSMVEMLGVLSIIGLLSAVGLFGFSKGMHMYQLSKTIELTAQAIRDFSLFEKQDARGYSTNTKDMAENALKTGLMSECDVQSSKIAGENYGVCRTPLGEIYPKFFVSNQNGVYYYTYMLFVTFLKAPHQSCVDFLSRNWGRSVPKKLWKKGRIWIVSDKGEASVYHHGGFDFKISSANEVCKPICEKASYCSVVFDFSLNKF
ncbi:MAG: hypothetical protein J5895_00175 [Alphaproteobacteria bacterium]|nr:hypothetical protein [Alphaproteobacteria bacterium]